jgi:hypothetical protein
VTDTKLPAVGRGGVLDLAATWARPETRVELETVQRFTDPSYADLSLAMCTGRHSGAVFDTLLARGLIVLHASEAERTHAIAERAVATILADNLGGLATTPRTPGVGWCSPMPVNRSRR